MSSFPIPAMAGFPGQNASPPPPDQFQYVKLPDGSYGKFSATATDDQIKSAIGKDFPQAFQQKPYSTGSPYLDALMGAAKQATVAVFGANGMGAGGQLAPRTDAELQTKGSWNPLSYSQGASLGNVASSFIPDLKAANPIAPALNNPNTAEGLGQSAINILLLRNILTGRVPTYGSPTQRAEVVGALSPKPIASTQATTNAAPTSVWPPVQPGVLQSTGKMTPTQLQDILETRSIQEAMQQDLERHGQSALSQERRTFFANNQAGIPKADLVQQANEILKGASGTRDTIMVKPQDFLTKTGTASTAQMNPSSIVQAKNAYSAGQEVEPPQISFDENGNVVGADGRHRAMGAALAGVDRIPVRVVRVNSNAVEVPAPQSTVIQTPADLINALRQMAAARTRK